MVKKQWSIRELMVFYMVKVVVNLLINGVFYYLTSLLFTGYCFRTNHLCPKNSVGYLNYDNFETETPTCKF